jgi:hypothetical protein
LKPGSKFIVWLYGREGNRLYLFFLAPIRWFSKWLPHRALSALSWLISVPAILYVWLCRALPEAPLPLRDYVNSIFAKLPPDKRRLVIYDQLNPAYAKYYTQVWGLACWKLPQ